MTGRAHLHGRDPNENEATSEPASAPSECHATPRSTDGLIDAISDEIASTSGRAAADDAIFNLGKRWGESRAKHIHSRRDLARALRRALSDDRRWNLAELRIDSFDFDPERRTCSVRGSLVEREKSCAGCANGASIGTSCTLAVGVATGLTAGLTGLDVVCTPREPTSGSASHFCEFEIRSAHSGPKEDLRRASGSAHFFLSSVGDSLGGGGEISLGDLVENSADAVILIDRDDIIRFWNRGAESLFQYDRREVVGRKVGFLVPPDLLAAGELKNIREVLERDGKLVNFVTRRIRKDGHPLSVSLTRTLLRDELGRAIGSTAIIRDITEQRRTELELFRTRELAMVGELAAKVAHEIKNPLAGIYAAVQLLARDLPPADPKREIFEELEHEIRRLDETARDLLNFARPLTPKRSPTPLASFVSDIVDSLERQPEVARHRIEIDIDEELVLSVDSRLLAQVVSNIVQNAAQAMEHPGWIRVHAARHAGDVVIEIQDAGPGVPEDVVAEIFKPFFTTKTRGTGLGLSIAKKNIEAHGGTITVENQSRGGACFRIVLPCDRS